MQLTTGIVRNPNTDPLHKIYKPRKIYKRPWTSKPHTLYWTTSIDEHKRENLGPLGELKLREDGPPGHRHVRAQTQTPNPQSQARATPQSPPYSHTPHVGGMRSPSPVRAHTSLELSEPDLLRYDEYLTRYGNPWQNDQKSEKLQTLLNVHGIKSPEPRDGDRVMPVVLPAAAVVDPSTQVLPASPSLEPTPTVNDGSAADTSGANPPTQIPHASSAQPSDPASACPQNGASVELASEPTASSPNNDAAADLGLADTPQSAADVPPDASEAVGTPTNKPHQNTEKPTLALADPEPPNPGTPEKVDISPTQDESESTEAKGGYQSSGSNGVRGSAEGDLPAVVEHASTDRAGQGSELANGINGKTATIEGDGLEHDNNMGDSGTNSSSPLLPTSEHEGARVDASDNGDRKEVGDNLGDSPTTESDLASQAVLQAGADVDSPAIGTVEHPQDNVSTFGGAGEAEVAVGETITSHVELTPHRAAPGGVPVLISAPAAAQAAADVPLVPEESRESFDTTAERDEWARRAEALLETHQRPLTTYSLKYFGVTYGRLGVLSKRVPLESPDPNMPSKGQPQAPHLPVARDSVHNPPQSHAVVRLAYYDKSVLREGSPHSPNARYQRRHSLIEQRQEPPVRPNTALGTEHDYAGNNRTAGCDDELLGPVPAMSGYRTWLPANVMPSKRLPFEPRYYEDKQGEVQAAPLKRVTQDRKLDHVPYVSSRGVAGWKLSTAKSRHSRTRPLSRIQRPTSAAELHPPAMPQSPADRRKSNTPIPINTRTASASPGTANDGFSGGVGLPVGGGVNAVRGGRTAVQLQTLEDVLMTRVESNAQPRTPSEVSSADPYEEASAELYIQYMQMMAEKQRSIKGITRFDHDIVDELFGSK
eukprot:Rmarinus@m.12118